MEELKPWWASKAIWTALSEQMHHSVAGAGYKQHRSAALAEWQSLMA